MHCHHEKLVIVDGEVAFVGGIDLTSLGGDRFDTQRPSDARPARMARRLQSRDRDRPWPTWGRISPHAGMRLPASRSTGAGRRSGPVTSSSRWCEPSPRRSMTSCPKGDFRILEAYTRALRSARQFVYLESQFLWSAQVVEILADKLREPPSDRFRVVVLLPAKPNNGADSTRGQLAALVRADDGAGRFLAMHRLGSHRRAHRAAVCSRQGRDRRRCLDDRRLGQPQRALVLQRHRDEHRHLRRHIARETRLRLWAEHLERSDRGGLRRAGVRGRRAVAPDRDRAARTPCNAASRQPIGCESYPACRAGRWRCSARSTACSSTAEIGRAAAFSGRVDAAQRLSSNSAPLF